MLEKEQPDSMATVQMTKADYAASEVYSTTSEPPPVSKLKANRRKQKEKKILETCKIWRNKKIKIKKFLHLKHENCNRF